VIGNSYIYGQNFPMARIPYTAIFRRKNPSFNQEKKRKNRIPLRNIG
jgi:hypothetical protein